MEDGDTGGMMNIHSMGKYMQADSISDRLELR